MKKREPRNEFDKIMDRYLPNTPETEVLSARDRLLEFLRERHQLQDAIDNFKLPDAITKLVSLSYVDQLVLTATYLLKGDDSDPLAIAFKVAELSPRDIDQGAILVSLDRLERGGLISSRISEEPPKGYKPVLWLSITEAGKTMLPDILVGARRLVEALTEFES